MARVFPERSASEAWGIASRVTANRVLNAALGRIAARFGPASLAPHVRPVGADPLIDLRAAGRPVVLVAWHAGLPAVLPSGLVALGLEALVLRHHVGRDADGIRYTTTRGRASAALQDAVRHLRAGGLVVCIVGARTVSAENARALPFLGRRVNIPPGPMAMARLGRATLLCAMPRRRGPRIELALADPGIAARDGADSAALVAWWDAYFREHPSDLWPEGLKAIASTQ